MCFYGEAPATFEAATGTFTKVVAGYEHTCALRSDGAVECIGNANGGTHTAAAGTFTDVDAGAFHTCAVNTGQFVECWGNNSDGQAKSEQRLSRNSRPSDPAIGDMWNSGAFATSGLTPIVTAGPAQQCSVSGVVVTFKAQGSCDIVISQPGNGNYLAAPNLELTIDVTGLQTPLSPTATAVSDAQVDVSWSDVSTRENRNVIQRRVRNSDRSFSAWQTVATTAANATSYSDTRVLPGITYQYIVSACSENGCTLPARTGVVTPLTTPAAPGSASAPAAAQITVTWTDASASEAGFEIERRRYAGSAWTRWALFDVAGANATSRTDGTVTDHTLYEYRVRVCNASGCSAYATTARTSTGVLPPGVTASATAQSATLVDVSWADGPGETRYVVQRAQRSGTWGAWGPAMNLAANLTMHNDTTVTSGSEYRYRVRACSVVGCSAWSSPVTVTTP